MGSGPSGDGLYPFLEEFSGLRSEDAQGDGPNLFALTEELVLRRAREIYAQGHG